MLYYILFLKVCYGIFILCFVFFILLDCYYILQSSIRKLFMYLISDNRSIIILYVNIGFKLKTASNSLKQFNDILENNKYVYNLNLFNDMLKKEINSINNVSILLDKFNTKLINLNNNMYIDIIKDKAELARTIYSILRKIDNSNKDLYFYNSTLKNQTEFFYIARDYFNIIYKMRIDLEELINEHFIAQNSLLNICSLDISKVKDVNSSIQKTQLDKLGSHTNLSLEIDGNIVVSTFTSKNNVCISSIYENILFTNYFKNMFMYKNIETYQYLSNIRTNFSAKLYNNCLFKEKKYVFPDCKPVNEKISNLLHGINPLVKYINSFCNISLSIKNKLGKSKCLELEEQLNITNEESMKQSYLNTDSICKDSQKISESIDNLIICLSNTLEI